jgi:hypothetical protein
MEEFKTNKFHQLLSFYKNNYKKYDIYDLFSLSNKNNYIIDVNKFRILMDNNPEHYFSYAGHTNLSDVCLNMDIHSQLNLQVLWFIITEFKMNYINTTEQIEKVFNGHTSNLIKLKCCTSNDPIHNINKNDSYNEFYNFIQNNNFGFAKNTIHEYANEPICRISIYSGCCLIWTKFIYKFPFTDFPDNLIPLICSTVDITVKVTDINGYDISDMNNKILLEYDTILLNIDNYSELINYVQNEKQYIPNYNMVFRDTTIYPIRCIKL